jgi:hypothetical protein
MSRLLLRRQGSSLPLHNLNGTLGNRDGIRRHRLLQSFCVNKIDIRKPFSLVNFHHRDRTKVLHSFFEQSFCHTLGRIRMLDESLRGTF